MTTSDPKDGPTQAQIEAAQERLDVWRDNPEMDNYDLADSVLTVALAAAARAGWPENQITTNGNIKPWPAAEAGEQRQEGMAWIAHESKLRTIERCAQYHDMAAEDCEKIAAVNMDNKLGADCLTRAQDHREDAAALRAMKEIL